jgi:hypothetical protein
MAALYGTMAVVEASCPVKKAADDFGIPPTSLRGHLMGKKTSHDKGRGSRISQICGGHV